MPGAGNRGRGWLSPGEVGGVDGSPSPPHPLPQWQARGTPELYALMSCLPDKPSYLPGRLLEVILNLPFIRDQRQELKAGVWGFQKNL